ncbi:MAG: hypothetical protein XD93_0368 [candidate division WS6 bacterium 34_10]|uniref:Uncharacterized protein n=1 Tax=candidate division WS6 bacterium 34_10 TaxID=1641389 RepID=A0A124FXA1_9BACT|nr:MAG: hypothetical protein XD93_0368 [candidate division WS6 bacterium 34_10]
MDYQKINKSNISQWESTLKYLTDLLRENNIKYYLSASGLNYVQGSNIYPYDIDMFVSKDSVKKAFSLLEDYKTSNLHFWEEDGKKLLEFQGIYNETPFEICEWEEEPTELKTVEFKDILISIIG